VKRGGGDERGSEQGERQYLVREDCVRDRDVGSLPAHRLSDPREDHAEPKGVDPAHQVEGSEGKVLYESQVRSPSSAWNRELIS
jgi:hypothetical protein